MATDLLSSILGNNNDRVTSLHTVLAHAPTVGLEEALKQFGGGLADEDKSALRGLSSDELNALSKGAGKLGGLLARQSMDNNVNI